MEPFRGMNIHFIGIGGAGMSALAQIALARGARVSGSDSGDSPALRRLEASGARIYPVQEASNIRSEVDLVVYSAAIPEENPELAAARRAGCRVISRAQCLGELMASYAGPRIAVTGTHGKTTTTAMAYEALNAAGLGPTTLVGGEYAAIGGNVTIGESGCFLTEACEAYSSFLQLKPDLIALTNVEADHLDHYETSERVVEAFCRFLEQTPPNAALSLGLDDPGVQQVVALMRLRGVRRRIIGYGLSPHGPDSLYASNIAIEGMQTRFDVYYCTPQGEERELGAVRLRVPGTHNALNAMAVIGVGIALDIPFPAIVEGLERFTGAGRRFEVLGEAQEILVMDDYAHHPTEIRATLQAARSAYPSRRLIAVFQPHLFSRTRDFMQEFAEALSDADAILLADIYPAREQPIPGVRVAEMARQIAQLAPDKTLLYLPDKNDLVGALSWVTRPGDLALTMGAGDIRQVGERFLEVLRRP
jgi:UDP-N-acetylmuramate--alanine ligase